MTPDERMARAHEIFDAIDENETYIENAREVATVANNTVRRARRWGRRAS